MNYSSICIGLNLAEIYHKHGDMVYNLALQYVQNSQDAEEITQDVFLSVHKNLSNFRTDSSLKTWIYRITINSSLDFIKALKRKKRRTFFQAKSIDDSSLQIAEFDHPGVQLEQKEALQRIFRGVNLLPENQKTALILLKIDGLSQAETAEIMNLSSKAVESLFQRAKKNLKNILDQNEGI